MSGIMGLVAAAATAGLAVTASPPSSAAGGTTANKALPQVGVAASGGSGSYTYAFSVLSQPASGATINLSYVAPSVTGIAITGAPEGEVSSGTVRCIATDTVTGLTATVNVPVSYTRSGGSL